jgi:hypothetical protein
MFVLLTSICFCLSSILAKNVRAKNVSLKNIKKYSSIKMLSVDSVKCYQAYTAALAALDEVTTRVSILKEGEQAAIDALAEFEAQCAAKAEDNICAQFLTDNASPVPDLSSGFATACAIPAPTEDSNDCPTAYDTLVDAIQGLASRIKLKNAATAPFNSFVTKCAKTSHKTECLAIIADVSTTDGPSKSILAEFQANCNPVIPVVTDPVIPVVTDTADSESESANNSDTAGDSNPANNNNGAIMGVRLNSEIYILIAVVSYIYLLI